MGARGDVGVGEGEGWGKGGEVIVVSVWGGDEGQGDEREGGYSSGCDNFLLLALVIAARA